ncbi:MAG: ABC transporter permease [Halobaculum sp.]
MSDGADDDGRTGDGSPSDAGSGSDSESGSQTESEPGPVASDGPAEGLRGRAVRLLDRLTGASVRERLAISVSALGLSVVVGAILVYGAGLVAECVEPAFLGSCYNPVVVFDELFFGAVGNVLADPTNGSLATTLAETTVLVFTGLSVAVAFRAGIFNIGTQGQMVVGGLATAVASLAVAPAFSGLVGTLVVLPFGLLVGAVAGGAYGAIPGALKAYADANEVITTIMLNFVATGVVLYLVRSRFQDPTSAATQTRTVPAFAQFPSVVFGDGSQLSLVATLLAVVTAGAVAYLLAGTSFGYDLRTSGVQPAAAAYGGVDAQRTVVAAMTLSGALGGVGGAVYVLMILGKFQTGVPAYGFDGITVSILAGNNPLGVGLAALLFGVLKSGSVSVDVATDVPPQLVGVLRGLIVLFVAMPEFFRFVGTSLNRSREPAVADGGRVAGSDGGDQVASTDDGGVSEPADPDSARNPSSQETGGSSNDGDGTSKDMDQPSNHGDHTPNDGGEGR